MSLLSEVSDAHLLRELHRLAGSQRRVMAELVLHLGEVDARRLYAYEGFPSLFGYCVGALQFSEDGACRRIEAARLACRFPSILALLEAGAVTLTVLGLLKPHLTPDNQAELLAGVSGKSVRRAEEWLAARFPRPDAPGSCQARAPCRVAHGILHPRRMLHPRRRGWHSPPLARHPRRRGFPSCSQLVPATVRTNVIRRRRPQSLLHSWVLPCRGPGRKVLGSRHSPRIAFS